MPTKTDPIICEPGEHSRIGASSAKRWMNCPGSIALAEALGAKTETNRYMAEGTAAHKLAEICLTQKKKPASFLGREIHVEGFVFAVDEEMSDAVNEYLKVCHETAYSAAAKRAGVKAFVEQKFSFGDDFGGTVDFAAINPEGNHVTVIDFKYGKGVEIFAEDNAQLKIYTLGLLLACRKEYPDIYEAAIGVVQPRLERENPLDISFEDVIELLNWDRFVLSPAVEAVRKSTGAPEDLRCGEWCRFCPASAQCPAQRAAALEIARQEFDVIDTDDTPELPAPATLSDDQIAKVLRFADTLSSWADSVRGEAQSRMEKGGALPGYKLVAKRANRVWADEATAEKTLCALVGEEKAFSKKLVSPAQAEKLVDDKQAIAALIQTPDNGLTIAPESDRRKAVQVRPGIEFVEDDLADIL